MTFRNLAAGAVVIATLSGCTGFRAFPDAPFDTTNQIDSTKWAFEKKAYDEYLTASGTVQRSKRNGIVNAQIRAYDIKFAEYEQSLFELGIGLGVGTDWASLALSGLTATVGGTTAKAAFGAVNAGIVGAKGALDKHLFMEKTLPVIMTEMANQRTAVLVQIRTGLGQSVSDYGLDQGLSDLRRYASAGSIAAGLQGIAASSGSELKKNYEALNKVTTSKYLSDVATAKLTNFWKPGGTVNAANTASLRAKMSLRGLATGPGRIAHMLTAADFAEVREKLVNDLGL